MIKTRLALCQTRANLGRVPETVSFMRVRQANISDASRIAEIHVDAWRAAYRGQMPDDVLENLDVEKRAVSWRRRLTDRPRGIFVAEPDREIVGFCDMIPSRDKDADFKVIAEIVAIYVHPGCWRKGAGRALCSFALESARLENFTAVTLWVLASNKPAWDFYEAMGFCLDGATKVDRSFGHYELHEVRFRISI
jgi:ribosomal protein S18 acetylase RimI-like enzyme